MNFFISEVLWNRFLVTLDILKYLLNKASSNLKDFKLLLKNMIPLVFKNLLHIAGLKKHSLFWTSNISSIFFEFEKEGGSIKLNRMYLIMVCL